MTVDELNRDQLVELKQRMICDENEEHGVGTSWFELEAADSLVSDERVREQYAGTLFTGDDFSC